MRQIPLCGYGQRRCPNDATEKKLKTIGLLVPILFASTMATTANAIECMDTRITVAIKQIAGRARMDAIAKSASKQGSGQLVALNDVVTRFADVGGQMSLAVQQLVELNSRQPPNITQQAELKHALDELGNTRGNNGMLLDGAKREHESAPSV